MKKLVVIAGLMLYASAYGNIHEDLTRLIRLKAVSMDFEDEGEEEQQADCLPGDIPGDIPDDPDELPINDHVLWLFAAGLVFMSFKIYKRTAAMTTQEATK